MDPSQFTAGKCIHSHMVHVCILLMVLVMGWGIQELCVPWQLPYNVSKQKKL